MGYQTGEAADSSLDEAANSEVFLDDDVCQLSLASRVGANRPKSSPFTAPMTKRICVVSVAQVKCV